MKMRMNKQTLQIFSMIAAIMIFRWYMKYRFIESPLPLEAFIRVFSTQSLFTNITHLLSFYTLFYLLLLNTTIPTMEIQLLSRLNRKLYARIPEAYCLMGISILLMAKYTYNFTGIDPVNGFQNPMGYRLFYWMYI